jgi:hypothetical protein
MQQLFKCLSDGKYTYRTWLLSDNQTISDIFSSHPESIKMFKLFPIVVVMDSTYNTNKYMLHLLEFVSTTSIEQTFSIGFTFITAEKEDNFVWALERCRELLKYQDHMNVVVTGRDVALMITLLTLGWLSGRCWLGSLEFFHLKVSGSIFFSVNFDGLIHKEYKNSGFKRRPHKWMVGLVPLDL